MGNYYESLEKAAESNWDLIEYLYNDKYEIKKPTNPSYSYDGILKIKENGKTRFILVEVKRRQFTNYRLEKSYNSELFLEKHKYDRLFNDKQIFEDKYNCDFDVWYISKTCDGFVYIYDITNKNFEWISRTMKKATYVSNDTKEKEVAYLHTKDADETLKTNLLY